MATVVDTKTKIEWDVPTTRARFPWDEWTNGEMYQAVQGDDFQCGPHSFTAQLRAKGEKISKPVKTRVEQNGDKGPASVFFQFGK